jgi:hypothetical protein
VMGFGLLRGFANLTMWPGELVRGFTYEYTAKKWYVAAGTSWLAGFGGGLSRMCAGLGDLLTGGYFGDVQLAKGYPDYVWQGDWVYHAKRPVITRDTSIGPERVLQPETDIKPAPVKAAPLKPAPVKPAPAKRTL